MKDRYDRQMRIPDWDQSKLKRARVLIAGMGALGNEVAKNLVLAGVGTLLLVDFDRVEYTNLNRTVLFSDRDVGSPKVTAASRSIARLSRTTKVVSFNQILQELMERHRKRLRGTDILIGCLDNREARFVLNHFSVANRIPYVDGGMFNSMGSVRVSVPPYTPCLECGIPQSTYGQVGQRYRCEDIVYEDLTARQMAVRHPTISTVTSATAAIQSHEALKILLGMDLFRSTGTWPEGVGKPVENEIQYDCRTNGFLTQSVHKQAECYVCGTHGISIDPVKATSLKVAPEDKVADIITKVQHRLKTKDFDLVKGLKPFPDRTAATTEARNLFQKLRHLSRLLAKPTLNAADRQECYRTLGRCLESDTVLTAQLTLRKGIPFHPDTLVAAMHAVEETIKSINTRISGSAPECLPTIHEIEESITCTLNLLGNDLSTEACRLGNGDILCAIGESTLNDIALEITLD
jgi:molybdopterin/thiamine biosynthesis adenylyltransferase